MNRGDLAGRETIRFSGAMRIAAELLLLEVENVQPTGFCAHPKQAGPITIDWHNVVITKAIRVGFIVSEQVGESVGVPVEIRQAQA